MFFKGIAKRAFSESRQLAIKETLDKLVSHKKGKILSMPHFHVIKDILNSQHMCVVGEASSGIKASVEAAIVEKMLRDRAPRKTLTGIDYKIGQLLGNVDAYFDMYKMEKRVERDTALLEPQSVLFLNESEDALLKAYSYCRKLDPQKTLKMSIIGSSLQIYSPVIDRITTKAAFTGMDDMKTQEQEFSRDNILMNASTNHFHILFSTPSNYYSILEEKLYYAKHEVNPQVIVFDNFHQSFELPIDDNPAVKLLAFYSAEKSPVFGDRNNKRQFIFSAPVLPDKFTDEVPLTFLQKYVPSLTLFQFPKLHCTYTSTNHQFIKTGSIEQKIFHLKEIIKNAPKKKKILIFCDGNGVLKHIKTCLNELKVKWGSAIRGSQEDPLIDAEKLVRGNIDILILNDPGTVWQEIEGIETIINVDMPGYNEEYLAIAMLINYDKGTIHNFVSPEEEEFASKIEARVKVKAPLDIICEPDSFQKRIRQKLFTT